MFKEMTVMSCKGNVGGRKERKLRSFKQLWNGIQGNTYRFTRKGGSCSLLLLLGSMATVLPVT